LKVDGLWKQESLSMWRLVEGDFRSKWISPFLSAFPLSVALLRHSSLKTLLATLSTL
jgi:hypothetical protein